MELKKLFKSDQYNYALDLLAVYIAIKAKAGIPFRKLHRKVNPGSATYIVLHGLHRHRKGKRLSCVSHVERNPQKVFEYAFKYMPQELIHEIMSIKLDAAA